MRSSTRRLSRPLDLCEFGEAPISATAGQHGNEIDGFGNRARAEL